MKHRLSQIHIMAGDITQAGVDIIVNAANRTLLGGGGVDGAIHQAAGPGLLEECRTLHGCETGKAKITGAYRLPARFVVHTVGPVYRDGGEKQAKLLADCYRNSMELAYRYECHSIAFPAISTGVYGYPSEPAAQIALQTVLECIDKHKDLEMQVFFYCFDQRTVDAYHAAVQQVEEE